MEARYYEEKRLDKMFQSKMIGRQRRAKHYRKNNRMTPGVKAHDTMKLREKLSSKPLEVTEAIIFHFDDRSVELLSPAVKAHFTRGTYNKYLAAY